MAKTKKQLQEEYSKELNEWITKCEIYSSNNDLIRKINSELEALVSEKKTEISNLTSKNNYLIKQMNQWCSKQIARLEAVKMLFSVMESGGTHRQKRLFYHQALIVIDSEIKNLQNDKVSETEDLPF
jgi:hypothetical protein